MPPPVARTPTFSAYVGIDYSGRGGPDTPCEGLRVYRATPGREATEVRADATRPSRHWTRRGVARWIAERCRDGDPLLVGVDHAFGFPATYLARRRVSTWDAFLDDFCARWPTHEAGVEDCRPGDPCSGAPDELRLADRWTSSAKSVFLWDVNGSVAKSTHAGLPWIRWLRRELGASIHVWPFDGWDPPPGRSVVAEVYPSLFRRRFPRADRTSDQQDAFAVAAWMRQRDRLGHLRSYFSPRLSGEERRVASLEGWILGVA